MRAGVLEVRAQRWIGRDFTPQYDVCFDERPGPVADRGDRLTLLEKRAHEGHRILVHAQAIGIHHAAGEHESVVVLRGYLAKRAIHAKLLTPVRVLPRTH